MDTGLVRGYVTCLFVYSLVEQTKKQGFVDVSQTYSNIIKSIREAEEAAKMADGAARHAVKVEDSSTHKMKYTHKSTRRFK